MVRRTTFLMLAVAAILLLQFADCMSAMTMDQQSMQCCGSMPCDPSNQRHDCCKSMASSQSPSVLPVAHVTLHPPTMDVADILPTPQVLELSEAPLTESAAPQHSPPELYTLHSSFRSDSLLNRAAAHGCLFFRPDCFFHPPIRFGPARRSADRRSFDTHVQEKANVSACEM